jgi:hypothetical protein
MKRKEIYPAEIVINKILLIRGQKVILDRSLAELYKVETRVLKQAVKRNPKRFPPDFIITLSKNEIETLVSQNVIPSKSYLGGAAPFAFTEQGVAMLSSVLSSDRAIEINILIMRAFVKIREVLATNKSVFEKLMKIEEKLKDHDEKIISIMEIVNHLLTPSETSKRKIGFEVKEKRLKYSAG